MQALLEEDYSSQLEPNYLKDQVWNDPVILKIAKDLDAYLATNHDYKYVSKGETKVRNDLIEIHEVLRELDSHKIYLDLFCLLWRKQQCTIQELVGSLWDKIEIESTFRRTSAIEFILLFFAESPVIEVSNTYGETVLFSCLVPLTEVQDSLDDRGYILPSISRPQLVEDNNSIGYQSYMPSLLLGGKHHNMELNYAHINRANSVLYESEPRLIDPIFNPKKKVRKDGKWETNEQVLARYEAFKHITDSIPKRKELLESHSKQFFYCHAYDTRGRFYPKAYEYNYQGIKYIKASVNLAHKELITGEF